MVAPAGVRSFARREARRSSTSVGRLCSRLARTQLPQKTCPHTSPTGRNSVPRQMAHVTSGASPLRLLQLWPGKPRSWRSTSARSSSSSGEVRKVPRRASFQHGSTRRRARRAPPVAARYAASTARTPSLQARANARQAHAAARTASADCPMTCRSGRGPLLRARIEVLSALRFRRHFGFSIMLAACRTSSADCTNAWLACAASL
mmetsp:Transcript_1856/g.4557  ORF Transcript_1856/g.4557 Transcript_1856/m.4557 type:complete len:205 (-) Transcript_1856:269-883(-)